MKAKYAVVPFVPAFIAMLFLKIMSIFGVDGKGNFMGMSKMNITYLVIGIALGLFVVCILINLFDRKTSPVYPMKKNLPAGFLAILTGFSIMASSINAASNTWVTDGSNTERVLLAVVCAVFAVPAGLALVLIARVHFSGKSNISNMSILYVFPSLWACAEVVGEFLQATKASIYSKESTGLFCYIFIALYLFTNSMVVSRIKGRNPVKGLFIYGLPMTAISLSYGIYELFRMTREFDRAEALFAVMFIAVALYAFSFIMEVFFNSYTKDDIEIVTDLEGINDESFLGEDADNETAAAPKSKNDTGSAGRNNTASKKSKNDVSSKSKNDVPSSKKKRNLGFDEKSTEEFFVGSKNDFSSPKNEKKTAPEKKEKPEKTKNEKPVKQEAPAAEKAEPKPAETAKGAFIGDLVFSDRGSSKNPNVEYDDDYYSTAKGMDDYIMGYDYDGGNDKQKNQKKKEKAEKKAAKKLGSEMKTEEQKKAAESEEKNDAFQNRLEKELKKKDAEAEALAEKKQNFSNKQSVEAILSANMSRSRKDESNAKDSSNIQKLSEELKRASQNRNLSSEDAAAAAAAKAEAEKARQEKEAKRAEAAKKAEEERRAAAEKKAEEERIALQVKQVEEARRLAAKRKAEEAKKAEEARRAEEAAKAEEARLAEEAAKHEVDEEAARRAEAVRRAVEERKAEESRRIAAAEEARHAVTEQNGAEYSDKESAIAEGQERYREKLSEVDEMLKRLGDQK